MIRAPQLHLDLARIVSNAGAIAASIRAELWATIKADAYGLGAARVAEALTPVAAGFCVFGVDEAIELDLWNRTRRPAIALGPPSTLDPKVWIEAHVRPAVSSASEAAAMRAARPILCVDTGMQRFACPAEQVEAALAAGAIDEAFTHATRMEHVRRLVELCGGRVPRLHAAATSLLNHPDAHLDAVRPGLALYRGALRVAAPLMEARRSQGPVGYTGWTSPTGFHGVITAGYAAGLRPGPCLVNGRMQQIPEVGMQSAYVTVDSADRAGDPVLLLGEGLTEAQVAQAWHATPHEVILRLAGIGDILTA